MRRTGFTLIEILLGISIAAILAFEGIAVVGMFHKSTAVRAHNTFRSALTEAAARARYSVQANTPWGVHINTDQNGRVSSLTLFAGQTYATRTPAHDIMMPVGAAMIATPALVTINPYPAGDGNEIVFESGNGAPHQTGTITLQTNSSTSTISITPSGMVLYAH